MRYFLVGLIAGIALFKFSSAVTCKSQNKYCKDGNCKDLECTHGGCQANGSCLCHQCFTGVTCNNYSDEHYPYFLKKEETIYIEETHEGLVYEARARDEDNFKTCLPESTLPCPCGEVSYEIIIEGPGDGFFTVDHALGDISLSKNAKLKAGDKFKVDIATSNHKEDFPYEQKEMSIDILTLNIIVRESNSVEKLIRLSAMENKEEQIVKYTYEIDSEMIGTQDFQIQDDIGVDVLKRSKRSAYAAVNGTTNMTLTVTNSVLEPIKPGTTINFTATIILSQILSSDPMDLSIEIFVMDAVTGITTFSICNVVVVSIGGSIAPTTVAQANQNIIMEFNSFLKNVYDRATIDFGTVVNSASSFGGPDYSDSTIIITFQATMIPNAAFTNSTAIVTCGAEYDSENYVWVSQASFNYSNTPQSYPSNVTIMGPDSINQYSGGTYDIFAYISNAYDNIEIDVFTPQETHDMFSITSLNIVSKGYNFGCLLGQDKYTFYRSVSGLTIHKYSIQFPIIVSNLDYSTNLANEASDPGNLIQISFTVFMYGATPSSVVSIGAGISIGTSTIWTALANVTVNPGAIPPSVTGSVTSMVATSVDSSTGINQPQVNMSMTATWDIHMAMSAASNAQITCTATPGANSNICGVNYGLSGKYVAVFPNLTEIVIYNSDGSATWSFITNTSVIGSSQTRNANQDYLSLEVTVVYLAASPSPATVTCGANSATLTALAGPAGILDVSGRTTILGNDKLWYYTSQAGLMTTLTFPPGGVGYSDMTLETSGDFFTTTFGAEVCQVDVVQIGRGIGCAASGAAKMTQSLNITKAFNTSLYNDAAVVDFGPICGSKRDSSYSRIGDNDLVIRVIYDIPMVQTVSAGTYNISLGVMFGTNVIWTGWGAYTLSSAVPSINATLPPMFTVIPPALTQPQFVPIVIKAYIKTHPGSIGNYLITASSSVPGTIDLCRIVILNVGYNYACIDTNPYGKEVDPTQRVTIIHSTGAWGASATLKLGILRNFGNGSIEPSTIADQDTIEIAVIARGTLVGSGVVTITYTDGTPAKVSTTNLTISGAPSVTTNSITMNVTGMDNTLTFYDHVMKPMVVTLNVPSQPMAYMRPVQLQIVNNSPLLGSICFAAVVWAGKNVPCAAPALLSSAPVASATQEIVQIDFGSLCYAPLSNNATENLIMIRFGLMPAAGQTSFSVNVVLIEAGTPGTPLPVTITSGGAYTPGNFSVDSISLFITDNATTTTVTPGQLIWLPLNITIPRGLTIPAQLGIMTKSSFGHAQATIQGFKWGVGAGKNIQCLETINMYNVTYMQNASIDNVTMYHTSQNDTLIADLKYITNNELSYIQGNFVPGDDTVQILALILIADHENLAPGSLIPVSFALKVGTAIIVTSKNFTLAAAAAPAMVLNFSISFADPNFDATIPLQQNQKLNLTVMLQHIWNQSNQEAYNAVVRIMLPSYIAYANASYPSLSISSGADSFTSNISANLTALQYLDFNIDYLFFTDILQLNFSVTVDPYNSMPKGLGTLDSTALCRFACSPSKSTNPVTYCSKSTYYVNYLTIGSECFDDLNSTAFLPCQFLASTAIDSTVAPEFSVTATGWSPATRDTTIFQSFLIIDFLRMARITKVQFTAVAGKRGVGTYSLQYSYDGSTFIDVTTCTAPLTSTTSTVPALCRFQSRYVRMIILSADSTDDTVAIGVSAKWFGCYTDAAPTAPIPCGLTDITVLTTTVGAWRHMAYDSVNLIVYFCDYNPMKTRMVCYSAKDSTPTTWTALPSYVGSLAGFYATTGMMYAYDTKKVAMVSSTDGANWALVDSLVQAAVATSATPPSPITGQDSTHFTPVTLGPWTADFTGIMNAGAYAVKWGKCCV